MAAAGVKARREGAGSGEHPGARPVFTTKVRANLGDGLVQGTDGSLWLYRLWPAQPVVDARDAAKRREAASPLVRLCDELASATRTSPVGGRRMSKSAYRSIHLLEVNIPTRYTPSPGAALTGYLRSVHAERPTFTRMVFVGIRLNNSMIRKHVTLKEKIRSGVEGAVESLVTASIPISEFDDDRKFVDDAAARAGLRTPTNHEMAMATGWWNGGATPDMPYLAHTGHLHMFTTLAGMRVAGELERQAQAAGPRPDGKPHCEAWDIADSYALTVANITAIDTQGVDVAWDWALWASWLIDAGARAISIRGLIEPAQVTRKEMASNRDKWLGDIDERAEQGRKDKADQIAKANELAEMEQMYALGGGFPTLVDTRVTVCFEGTFERLDDYLSQAPLRASVAFNQLGGFLETLVCSNITSNPHMLDLPVPTVACSGPPSLSTVGDKDGALLGFSESDRQPAYVSPYAVAQGDHLPLMLVLGATGSGKSVCVVNLCQQWAKMTTPLGAKTPVVMVDLKSESDFSAGVLAAGGRVVSLDEIATSDGVFDPIRFERSRDEGIKRASTMLLAIDPWAGRLDAVTLIKALATGVDHGATCTGQALALAAKANPGLAQVVGKVEDLARSLTLFRTLCGFDPTGEPLSVTEGLTLIKAGSRDLSDSTGNTLPEKIDRLVMRMCVSASYSSMIGRYGVVFGDEAWMFLQDEGGAQDIQRMGRLARSQKVLPVFASQRVKEFIDAGLAGYVSRGILLALPYDENRPDESEAVQAMRLFRLSEASNLLARMSAPDKQEGTDQPNWTSFKALRHPYTGNILRGSIALYVDFTGRAVPVEITIPHDFLRLISTNAKDQEALKHQ